MTTPEQFDYQRTSGPLPFEYEGAGPLPDVIHGYVSVRSQGGESCFEISAKGLPDRTEAFQSSTADRGQAVGDLESMGFSILAQSRLGCAVAGPAGAYEELTGGTIRRRERLMHAESGRTRYVTHLDIVGPGQPEVLGRGNPRSAAVPVEGVAIERPRVLQGVFPSPVPPSVGQFHLRVPDDVSVALGAAAAHRQGRFGQGVRVAMVDSGQYAHPFFAAHSYDVEPAQTLVPGTDPTKDPVGHGTGESANVFAVAPGAELEPYRAADRRGRLVAALSGFLAAKSASPQVLTNSWGGDGPYPPTQLPDQFDIAWALEILDAIEQGIFVVFSAGNGSFTIEPQVPGVLAAGGVYMTPDLDFSASNYASGYPSPWFDLTVPDVCGLVGLLPRAQYLLLPLPPASEIDVDESQPRPPSDPNDDGTASNDGWALFSGTSAAAPQVAGAAAVVIEGKPGLTPAQITEALKATAIDISAGRCHPRFNFAAQNGHDAATGYGLVNANAALEYAKSRF